MNLYIAKEKSENFLPDMNALDGFNARFLKKYFERAILLQEKGSVSIASTFSIIAIFLIIGLVSVSVVTTESRDTVNFIQAMQARYLAEAGIEYGIKRIFLGDIEEYEGYSESVSIYGGTYNIAITEQSSVLLELTSTGGVDDASKAIKVEVNIRPPIGDFGVFSAGEVDNVTPLNEAGDPDSSLMVENAPYFPDIDNAALIALATSQGYVDTTDSFEPDHGYPNFNFYYSGTTPNVTYVQGDLRVHGGRTVYGIFIVDGDIRLDGASRVEGVLYMINPNSVIMYGGGSPSESSVTGGVFSNGDIDGTGNHITVRYKSEYTKKFENFENRDNAWQVLSWREP